MQTATIAIATVRQAVKPPLVSILVTRPAGVLAVFSVGWLTDDIIRAATTLALYPGNWLAAVPIRLSLTGAGVTVGVLSDSFNCYAVYAANNVPAAGAAGYANNGFLADAAMDMSTGDLPSTVNVLEEAQAGNGGCMNYGAPTNCRSAMKPGDVDRYVAPGAGLAFTPRNSEAGFCQRHWGSPAPAKSSPTM